MWYLAVHRYIVGHFCEAARYVHSILQMRNVGLWVSNLAQVTE